MATRRGSPPQSEDALLTIDELEAKGREVLLLQCDPLHIPTSGTARELAERLYERYHPAVAEKEATPFPEEEDEEEEEQYQPSPQMSPLKADSSSTTSSSDDDDSPDKRHPKRRRTKTADDNNAKNVNNHNGGDTPDESVDVAIEVGEKGSKRKKNATKKQAAPSGPDSATQEYADESSLATTALEASENNARLIQTFR